MRPYQARPKSKYADPRWQKKRLEVMQRDGFRCLHCGNDKATLNVHHSYYVAGRDPWEYATSTMLTLCEPCHEAVSGGVLEYSEQNDIFWWWEIELNAAFSLMLKLPAGEWDRVDIYSSIYCNEAVLSGKLDPLELCKILSNLAAYLPLDRIVELSAEAEKLAAGYPRAIADRMKSEQGGAK